MCPFNDQGHMCGTWCPHHQQRKDVGLLGGEDTYIVLSCTGKEVIYHIDNKSEL